MSFQTAFCELQCSKTPCIRFIITENMLYITLPARGGIPFYTWDSGFIGLDMLEFSPKIADYILDLYLSDKNNKDYAFLLHGSPVPVHLYQYYEMLQKTSDKSELYDYYDRAKMFYDSLREK